MSISAEEKNRLNTMVAKITNVSLPPRYYDLDTPSVVLAVDENGRDVAVVTYEATSSLVKDAVFKIPVIDLSEAVGVDRVVILSKTTDITPEDFVEAFNEKYDTNLLATSLSADTLANFPISTPFNGLKVSLDGGELFHTGEVVVSVDSIESLLGKEYIDAPPKHNVILGYYNNPYEDTLEVHQLENQDKSISFTPYRNITTVNNFTIDRMFKVSGDRIIIQGDFDIEVVFDNTIGPVSIPDGTMMLVDKTGLVLSVDTTALSSTEVFVVHNEKHDHFACLYNVSGNYTVIKSYPYDLTQAPVTSTLPVGPISAAAMDQGGNIVVGTRPDVSVSPVVTRVSRLVQNDYAYSIDTAFSTVELSNAYNSTDSTEVTDIVLDSGKLLVYYTPVTHFSRELYDPVLNGSPLRAVNTLDLDLYFGYIPVLVLNEDGTQVPGYESNRQDFTESALESVNPAHPADGSVMDPLSDFKRFLLPGNTTEGSLFCYLRSVDSGPTGKPTPILTNVFQFSHKDEVVRLPGFTNRYPHIVKLCDYTTNNAVAFVAEAYDHGDPIDPVYHLFYKEDTGSPEITSIRLGKGIVPPDFIMLVESSD